MYCTWKNPKCLERELPNPQWNRNGHFTSVQCVLCWSLRTYVHCVHTTFCKNSKSYCYFIRFAKGCFKLSRAGVKTCHARNQRQTCGCSAPSRLQLIPRKENGCGSQKSYIKSSQGNDFFLTFDVDLFLSFGWSKIQSCSVSKETFDLTVTRGTLWFDKV